MHLRDEPPVGLQLRERSCLRRLRFLVGIQQGGSAEGSGAEIQREPVLGGSRHCGVSLALDWIDHHYTVSRNPGYAGSTYYYLYGLERVGALLELERIGERAWYRDGAQWLVGQTYNWTEAISVQLRLHP